MVEHISKFELFPLELREKILNYLSVADLLSCCWVSSELRTWVNLDPVWKRHCKLKLFTPDIYQKYKAIMFDNYEYDEKTFTLEPLCFWRLVYAVNMQLKKDWRNKKFYVTHLRNLSKIYCLEFDETHLASGHENGSISLWNIKDMDKPIEEKSLNKKCTSCLLKGTPVVAIRLSNKHVLALQKQLLHIFSITEKGLLLVGARSFELGENSMNLMENVNLLGKKFDHWYKECLRNNNELTTRRLKFSPCKNLCFASVGGSDAVDIWTTSGQPKAQLTGFANVRNILVNDGIVYIISGYDPTVVSRYCWNKNESEKLLSVSGFKKIVFGEQYILALPHAADMKLSMLRVWDKSYKLVNSRLLSSGIVSAIAPSVVVYSENSLVTVWDPRKNQVLKTFSTGGTIGFARHAFSTVMVLFMNASLDAWDFLEGRYLCRLYSNLEWSGDFRDLLWVNPGTLIAGGVRQKIAVLQFICLLNKSLF